MPSSHGKYIESIYALKFFHRKETILVESVSEEEEQIKKQLVKLIIEGLRANILSVEQAQGLARDYLALLPAKSKEGLLDILKKLVEKYALVVRLYDDFATKYQSLERVPARLYPEDELPKNQHLNK